MDLWNPSINLIQQFGCQLLDLFNIFNFLHILSERAAWPHDIYQYDIQATIKMMFVTRQLLEVPYPWQRDPGNRAPSVLSFSSQQLTSFPA